MTSTNPPFISTRFTDGWRILIIAFLIPSCGITWFSFVLFEVKYAIEKMQEHNIMKGEHNLRTFKKTTDYDNGRRNKYTLDSYFFNVPTFFLDQINCLLNFLSSSS